MLLCASTHAFTDQLLCEYTVIRDTYCKVVPCFTLGKALQNQCQSGRNQGLDPLAAALLTCLWCERGLGEGYVRGEEVCAVQHGAVVVVLDEVVGAGGLVALLGFEGAHNLHDVSGVVEVNHVDIKDEHCRARNALTLERKNEPQQYSISLFILDRATVQELEHLPSFIPSWFYCEWKKDAPELVTSTLELKSGTF